jgi:ribosome-associated protein
MDIRKLQRAIVDGLEDVKAQNIVVFNTEHLSSLFERVIIASGTSNRQTKSLASSVREAVKKAGFPIPRMEGEDNGEWIIVDCGAAVAHVMQPAIRDYYHLEEIWGDKPIRMSKVDGLATRLVKASEDDSVPASKAAAKKAAAKKAPAKTAGKTSGKTVGKTVGKAPAKAPARTAAKPAPAKRAPAAPKAGVTRVTGVKTVAKTAAKKAAVKKPAPKTLVVKKAAPRKTGGRA